VSPGDRVRAPGRVGAACPPNRHFHATYDPATIGKPLEIFRVSPTWLWRGQDSRTAAERIGLAVGRVREDHVLGFDLQGIMERLLVTGE
jgi:hypothetical protein